MMKKILVIDNYDSFTYNLVYYIEKLTGIRPSVFRNDEISMEAVGGYDKILLSPGPGVPVDAGIIVHSYKNLCSIKKYSWYLSRSSGYRRSIRRRNPES